VSNICELVGDFTNPILQPEATEVVKQHGELSKKSFPIPRPATSAGPAACPLCFGTSVCKCCNRRTKSRFSTQNDYDVRHVYMNRTHPEQVTPSWYGDSVGHYEGDTLVTDTVGIKFGPFAMVDIYGTPHTEAPHVVERYRLLDYESANESEDRGITKIFAFRSPTRVSRATRITRARDCCSSLQSMTRASSRPPGQPGLLIGARRAVGRNSSR
jgi:hypothetical protein